MPPEGQDVGLMEAVFEYICLVCMCYPALGNCRMFVTLLYLLDYNTARSCTLSSEGAVLYKCYISQFPGVSSPLLVPLCLPTFLYLTNTNLARIAVISGIP